MKKPSFHLPSAPRHPLVPFLLSGSLLASAGAQTKEWALTEPGSWNLAENWTPSGLPTSSDDVVFGASAAGTVTLDANQVASTLSFANAATVTLTGGGTNRTLTVEGAITIAGAGGVTFGSTAAGQNVALTAGPLVKGGAGTLELANLVTLGDLFLNQGDTILRNATGLGSEGTITLGDASGSNPASFRIQSTTVARPLLLGGTTGQLRLYNLGFGNGIFTGGITGANDLRIDSVISGGSGSLTFNTGPIAPTGTLSLNHFGNATANNVAGTLTFNSAIASSVTDVTVNNLTTANSGITRGVQRVIFSSPDNSYTGATTIGANARLDLGQSEVLPHGPEAGDLTVNGTLLLRTATGDSVETINGLYGGSSGIINRTGATGTTTLVVGANDADGSFEGTILNAAGTVALTKVGAGTLVLSGPNTYTGLTTVAAGTLVLEFSDMIADDSNVDIAEGATLQLNDDPDYPEIVGSLRFDGEPQAVGTWGAPGNAAADYTSDRLAGPGLLEVTRISANSFWDGTGTSWSSATAWSFNDSDPAADPGTAPGLSDSTYFGSNGLASDQTVRLDGDQAALEMFFLSPVAFDFVGGNAGHTLSVGSGGITLDVDAGDAAFGSSVSGQEVAVRLSAAQTWTNRSAAPGILTFRNGVDLGSSNLTVTGSGDTVVEGAVTGSGALVKSGAGALTLGGASSYTGGTTLANAAGRLSITNGSALGTGNVILQKMGTNAGVLELSQDITVANNFTFGSATGFGGGGSAHIRNLTGNNTLTGTLTLNTTGGNGINLESAEGLLTVTNTITSTISDNTRQLGLSGEGNGLITGNIVNTGENAFSVIKSGNGTWTLAGSNAYTGGTSVNAGTLTLSQNGGLADTASVTIQDGATLRLDFTGSDVIAALTLAGEAQGPGTYGASHPSGLITGSGALVIPGPEPSEDPFTAWIETFSFAEGADQTKAGDPDGDGLINLLEFALDGDPASAGANDKVIVRVVDGYLTLTLPVRTGASFTGSGPLTSAAIDEIIYRIEGSTDLAVFSTALEETAVVAEDLPDLSTGWTYRTFRLTTPVTSAPQGFLRAVILDGAP